MAVDLTQFVEGDDILVTYRAWVSRTHDGSLRAALPGNYFPELADAVSAEHVTPEIKTGDYYTDAVKRLYIGGPGGSLYGPIGPLDAPNRQEPTQVALIRGLRPAEVRPVVPA